MDRSADDPSQAAVDRELQEKLRAAVSDLPAREAQIFCLIHFEKLSHTSVSEQLGISSGAVAKGIRSLCLLQQARIEIDLRRWSARAQ